MSQSSYSNYPSGFPNGVLIQGVPYQKPAAGQVYWVNGTTVVPNGGKGGSNGNKGTYLAPFATIDYAIGQCTAGRGDVIYVMPGHVETISAAASVDIDVDGVSIIGLGRGSDQARFDFTNAAGTVEVNADNCSIVNMNFHANVTSVVIGLSILTLATDTLVQGCTFDVETTTTDEFLISINLGVGCDRTVIDGCKMDMGLGGAAAGVKLVGASDHVQIKNSEFQGDYSLAIISGITTLSTNVLIENNLLLQGTTGGLNAVAVIVLLTGTTGVIRGNDIICDVATFALQTVADTCSFLNNNRTDDISEAKTSAQVSASVTASADA
jgi:hypothetical protein